MEKTTAHLFAWNRLFFALVPKLGYKIFNGVMSMPNYYLMSDDEEIEEDFEEDDDFEEEEED
jgi:hypothetical protein